ncbi:hypothetical protein TRFO_32739 [Tritrichomonas foetus]|uniref:Anaphase-promoting complex subunit 4 WD40 domain-containing protein n=1 Tax=Tritrichomonas foetus TaxID=1144522 RepID=A0A1J4JQ15_9EUKA|nr:hypothetical protein TRFO_32739 [Tritrichomonas foetus]|eukprot:OHT00512.1 hypothetical protein TRFO_32739 [Tritrichomonas foetus]
MLGLFRRAKKRICAFTYTHSQELFNDRISDMFCVAFENGFAVFDGDNGNLKSIVQSPYVDTSFIKTINSSNIVAIVPKDEGKIHLWDRNKGTFLCEILIKERTRMTNFFFRPDCLIAINLNSINFINFFNQTQISSVITSTNLFGAFDMPFNFSSEISAILSHNVGCFTFYSYINPDMRFHEIKAFNKDINILKISPNGKIVAVSSLGHSKVKCYRIPSGEEVFTVTLPISDKGAAAIEFDRYDSALLIVTPSNALYLYSMKVTVDVARSLTPISIRYDDHFSLPSSEFFWAHFGSRANTIIVVSQSGVYRKLKFDSNCKNLKVKEEKLLDFDIPA